MAIKAGEADVRILERNIFIVFICLFVYLSDSCNHLLDAHIELSTSTFHL